MRVEEYYSADSCSPRSPHHKKIETPSNAVGEKLHTSYDMKGLLEPKLEIKDGAISGSLDFPSGIFSANLQIMDEISQNKSKSKDLASNSKIPSWSQCELQEAIESVITQQLRFTQ